MDQSFPDSALAKLHAQYTPRLETKFGDHPKPAH
jgi:hypothetical protein